MYNIKILNIIYYNFKMDEINFSEKVTDVIYNVIKKTEIFENGKSALKCASMFMFITCSVCLLSYNKINKVNLMLERNNDYKEDIQNLNNKLDKLIDKLDKNIETNEEIIIFLNNYNSVKNIADNIEVIIEKNHDANINEEKSIEIETNMVHKASIIDDKELMNDCYDNIPCNNFKKITNVINLFNLK